MYAGSKPSYHHKSNKSKNHKDDTPTEHFVFYAFFYRFFRVCRTIFYTFLPLFYVVCGVLDLIIDGFHHRNGHFHNGAVVGDQPVDFFFHVRNLRVNART